MARTDERPAPPRVSHPDLPPILDDAHGLRAREEHHQVRITGLDDVTDAAHADVSECRMSALSASSIDLTGAVLVDVAIDGLRATTVSARGARLRRVRIDGGRIGTLDLADADLDEVELRGIRIDYLSLSAARVQDLLVADCTIATLDLPRAAMRRVRFERTTADEVDPRLMQADDLDLRGLEALSWTDAAALRGATLTLPQVERLAPALAASVGIDVRD